MTLKDNAPGRGRGAGARNSDQQRSQHNASFTAAGSTALYYVAILDENRHLIERLSGFIGSFEEARHRLRWLKRRHQNAVIVRELTLIECFA